LTADWYPTIRGLICDILGQVHFEAVIHACMPHRACIGGTHGLCHIFDGVIHESVPHRACIEGIHGLHHKIEGVIHEHRQQRHFSGHQLWITFSTAASQQLSSAATSRHCGGLCKALLVADVTNRKCPSLQLKMSTLPCCKAFSGYCDISVVALRQM